MKFDHNYHHDIAGQNEFDLGSMNVDVDDVLGSMESPEFSTFEPEEDREHYYRCRGVNVKETMIFTNTLDPDMADVGDDDPDDYINYTCMVTISITPADGSWQITGWWEKWPLEEFHKDTPRYNILMDFHDTDYTAVGDQDAFLRWAKEHNYV